TLFRSDLLWAQTRPVAQQVISLADDLHIRVLDAIVHHLDEVARAIRADVRTARLTINLRGDGLQQRAQGVISLGGATRHDRRPVQGALLATGDSGADEVQAARGDLLFAADRVRVQGVAAIDDDVARVHELSELLDHGVRGGAGLHHDECPAWLFEGGDEGPKCLGGDKRTLLAEVLHEGLGTCESAVENRHGVAVIREVAGGIGARHRQANHADLGELAIWYVCGCLIRGKIRCRRFTHDFPVYPDTSWLIYWHERTCDDHVAAQQHG